MIGNAATTQNAVAQARGLLWLAEVCRDEGIEVRDLQWSAAASRHVVGVADQAAVRRLAERLGLWAFGGSADGRWAELLVTVEVAP